MTPRLERDVPVRRLGRAVVERLELVVALAREEHLRVAIVRHVLTGDSHAPDLQRTPPVGLGVLARRLVGRDAPELLLALAVVVPVVRHAQVALAGPAPVAEQDRQRAVPGAECDRRRVPVARRRRPNEFAVVAPCAVGQQVVGEGERRERVRALPRRAESNRPGVAAVDTERLVRILEVAVPEPAEDDVAAVAQDGEVDVAVAVDVERIRAGDRGQVGDRRRLACKAERAAHRALVEVQRGRLGAAGEEQLGATVVIAVERRHSPADEELELTVVGVVDARRARLVDETRRLAGGRRRLTRAPGRHHQREHHDDDRHPQRGDDRPAVPRAPRAARPLVRRRDLHVGHGRIEPHWMHTVVECGRRTRPLRR